MPELPDIEVYLEALRSRVRGTILEQLRIQNPFVLRSVDPPASEVAEKAVTSIERLGKRIVFEVEGECFLIIHLMIAGRLHWHEPGAPIPKRALAALVFSRGTMDLTEAGSTRRASIHIVRGRANLESMNRGGLEVLTATPGEFRDALTRERHTLKRALTDPRILSGIGNAYSDEILHAARLSPLRLTGQLNDEEIDRLYRATRTTLQTWVVRLRAEAGTGFPGKVTAFRKDMAVHGRFRLPCPACGSPVQRIVYATNEVNYCAPCQTGGKLLADRAWSRLMKEDWPRTLEELEDRTVR